MIWGRRWVTYHLEETAVKAERCEGHPSDAWHHRMCSDEPMSPKLHCNTMQYHWKPLNTIKYQSNTTECALISWSCITLLFTMGPTLWLLICNEVDSIFIKRHCSELKYTKRSTNCRKLNRPREVFQKSGNLYIPAFYFPNNPNHRHHYRSASWPWRPASQIARENWVIAHFRLPCGFFY